MTKGTYTVVAKRRDSTIKHAETFCNVDEPTGRAQYFYFEDGPIVMQEGETIEIDMTLGLGGNEDD